MDSYNKVLFIMPRVKSAPRTPIETPPSKAYCRFHATHTCIRMFQSAMQTLHVWQSWVKAARVSSRFQIWWWNCSNLYSAGIDMAPGHVSVDYW